MIMMESDQQLRELADLPLSELGLLESAVLVGFWTKTGDFAWSCEEVLNDKQRKILDEIWRKHIGEIKQN